MSHLWTSNPDGALGVHDFHTTAARQSNLSSAIHSNTQETHTPLLLHTSQVSTVNAPTLLSHLFVWQSKHIDGDWDGLDIQPSQSPRHANSNWFFAIMFGFWIGAAVND
ncbi:hypothetical protein AVEN_55028-1 [Araneus ventricosus]|uniref:Uncharacterized protein n=1 Tax=Araneus ventricosus TaxID=182803 RepID=A0A4Y2AJ45_ARAVE|nr:hypothetical protein AVEN_55028-1 [Araneus ventricosus]